MSLSETDLNEDSGRHKLSLPTVTDSDGDIVIVQLLSTNDTHSSMELQDVDGGRVGGLVRRAVAFQELRDAIPDATLVLDAGDHFSGSEYFSFLQGEAEMEALATLRYDAAALGNHDFDAVGDNTIGLDRFKQVAARHAPSVKMLCGNVFSGSIDGDNENAPTTPTLEPLHIFEVQGGIKVGVAAVLGAEAWNVTAIHLREGYRHTDFLESARTSATTLRAAGCTVLVMLSHTGVNRGDMAIAEEGLYDVIFSGHEHFDQPMENLFQVDHGALATDKSGCGSYVPTAEVAATVGSDATYTYSRGGGNVGNDHEKRLGLVDHERRLGLLSRGIANGHGICWARLAINTKSNTIISHTSGAFLLDDNLAAILPTPNGAAAGEAARKCIFGWREKFEAMANRIVGTCGREMERKVDVPSSYVWEETQSGRDVEAAIAGGATTKVDQRAQFYRAVATAVRTELVHHPQATAAAEAATFGATDPSRLVLVIQNRNSVSNQVWKAGNITYGQVRELLPFPNPLLYIEIQGAFLLATLKFNEQKIFSANFLFVTGITNHSYTLKSGDALPDNETDLTKADVATGAVIVSGNPQWGGRNIDQSKWYPCVLDEYLLDTILSSVQAREGGFRGRTNLNTNYCEMVTSHLERGGVFGSSL